MSSAQTFRADAAPVSRVLHGVAARMATAAGLSAPRGKEGSMLERMAARLMNWLSARRGSSGRRHWHKATAASPVRLRDGSWSRPGEGQLWRRETRAGWEYEQDDGFEEPDDDAD